MIGHTPTPMADPQQAEPACPDEDGVIFRLRHDETGWRIQVHLHANNDCCILEGQARYATPEIAKEQSQILFNAMNAILGLQTPPASSQHSN